MSALKIYYVTASNPYQIELTESIDDLVTMLYDGTAEFITEVQITELSLPPDYLTKLRKLLSKYEYRVPPIRYHF